MSTTNGTTNGHIANGGTKNIPVTKLFSEFIANASPKQLTPELRTKLKEVIVDFIGVTAGAAKGAESTPSIVKGIVALGGQNGSSTVLATGKNFTPQYAALLNACFGHSFDFDDTYAEGTLHAGVTVIAAAMAEAEASKSTVDDFLISVAVGYETTCRLGRALGFDAYSRGFHNTSTAGIFGAVATLSVLRHLSAPTIEMAFGLAGSKASGSMQYLDNGSWNKRLHPGFAAHDAFVAVALAEAGVIGATKALEGKFGFLQAYSPKQDKDLALLTRNLGQEWVFLASSLKPYPACRMTHGYIEMAGQIASEATSTGRAVADIDHITLTISPANYSIVAETTPNKLHPQNAVDAQFSAYFQTAHALLYGSNTGWAAYSKLGEPAIDNLSDQISVVKDSSYRRFECGVKVVWKDGSVKEGRIPEPLGEVEHPYTRDRVDEKFFSLADGVYGHDAAVKIRDAVDGIEGGSLVDVMRLL